MLRKYEQDQSYHGKDKITEITTSKAKKMTFSHEEDVMIDENVPMLNSNSDVHNIIWNQNQYNILKPHPSSRINLPH